MKYKSLLFRNMKRNIDTLHRLNKQPGKLFLTLMKQVWCKCYDDFHDPTPGRKKILGSIREKLALICINKNTGDEVIQSLIKQSDIPMYPVLWSYIQMD